jgi:hypothetical protein
MGELIGAYKQVINHEGWVVQGEMVCVNGPVEQPQREDALFLPSLYTQIGMVCARGPNSLLHNDRYDILCLL